MRPLERLMPRILSVGLLVMIGLEALLLVHLLQLPFSRITVLNYDRVEDLYRPDPPTPGVTNTWTDSRGVTQVIVGPDYGILRQYRLAVQNDAGGRPRNWPPRKPTLTA